MVHIALRWSVGLLSHLPSARLILWSELPVEKLFRQG